MTGDVSLTGAQRAAAIDRTGESIALLSGAGCGKTFVLSKRYVQLLLAAGEEKGEKADMSRLVALTFTDKAALEMSQRVRRELMDLAQGATGQRRRMLLQWIEQLPQARISTIHSFCASILRGAAVEAGVDPSFTVCADALIAGEMVAEAADEALLDAIEGQSGGAAELLNGNGSSFGRIVEFISHLIDRRTSLDLAAWTDGSCTMRRWREQLVESRLRAWRQLDGDDDVRRLIRELQDARCTCVDDKLLPLRDGLLTAAHEILSGPDCRTPRHFAVVDFSPGNRGSDRNWGRGEKGSAGAVRRAMKDLSAAMGRYAIFAEELGALDERAAEALASLAALAVRAQAIYTAAKRARGMLDFTDLIERTGMLLSTRPAVRRALAGRIDQLLIDECQDTDAFQASMLGCLIFSGEDDSAPPPPGRLFVVGDAKQSIYRFRGAQVEVFSDLCRRMGPDNVENLDLSFRTHAPGVAFVNELFAPLMGGDYAPIAAHRGDLPEAPSVEILLASCDEGPIATAADASQAQAAVTAGRIRRMLDEGERLVWDAAADSCRAVRAGDICILLSRMTDSLRYERELQQRNIPYYVIAGTGFFRRQEVYDLLNALGVIDRPHDDMALLGLLRSDMFALDDNALMRLSAVAGLPRPYLPSLTGERLEAAAASLGEPHGRSLRLAVEVLSTLRKCKDAIPIDRLIERLLEATGYEAVMLAQKQGRRMLGNVRMLIERARTASAEGVALADFITQVRQLVINQSRYEQAAVVGESDDVVRIMTIHKAKGLEFPVVVLPDLNASRRSWSEPLLIRRDWGLTWHLAPADDDDERPLSSRIARRLENDDQRDEDIRKWYVAATRHSDHLVFVGADWRDRRGAFRNAGCFLGQMDEVLGISAAVDAGKRTIEYAGGRFAAVLRRMTPSPAGGGQGRSAGAAMLSASASGEDFVERVVAAARGDAPPLLGPIPLDAGRAALAVTALGQFEHCPMLYRWQYELRAPVRGGPSGGRVREGALDAAAAGTLFHRCMELLDFARPQRSCDLVARAAAEMELADEASITTLAAELQQMIERFRSHELWPRLAAAGVERSFRELDFALQLGPVTLRGQIDMLYVDDDGAGHIVDYKSDRLGSGESIADHCRRYELQMLVYALAARAHLSAPPADATLYFLRTGQAHHIEITDDSLDAAGQRIGELCRRLITARRSSRFDRLDGAACDGCPYGPLCRDR